MPIIHGDPDFLAHYGVLGMKWGVRRFQNEDGSLTAAGKERYKADSVGHNIGRAIINNRGSLGQQIAVRLNKGYRSDKANIKAERDKKRTEIEKNSEGKDRRTQLKSLQKDYLRSLGEARTSAAQVMYPWQNMEENERIQSQRFGTAVFKRVMMGGYGSMAYDKARANNRGLGIALLSAVGHDWLNNLTFGTLPIAEYAVERHEYKKKQN